VRLETHERHMSAMRRMHQETSGKLRLERSFVCLEEVIREALTVVQSGADAKQVYIGLDVDPAIGLIYADRARVQQIAWNLLSNAIKFTGQGRVLVSVVPEPDTIRVSVADTGIGIREDDLARLFEPFQQLDNPVVRSAGGTGLGLAISKKFVELHGGRIWAESRENQGSTFHFTIPLT
jgi:signal transduction histidine kinase